METQTPKWIAEARKMISGCDSRVKHYWNNLNEDDQRSFCFLASLKSRHVGLSWEELEEKERVFIWHGILKIRRLQQETKLLSPEDFKGSDIWELQQEKEFPTLDDLDKFLAEEAKRVARRKAGHDANNSMH